jgi:hypothetical protein
MAKVIFELIFQIVKLICFIFAGCKFVFGDVNKTKTLYYGIWTLWALMLLS